MCTDGAENGTIRFYEMPPCSGIKRQHGTHEMKDRKLTGHWAGFAFKGGRLVTPEGRELLPEDLAWLGLTAALAQEYRRLLAAERHARAVPRSAETRIPGAGRAAIRTRVFHSAEPCPVVPMVQALQQQRRR